jgi:NitT/TauT family transport system substrate-binding protein
MRRCCPLIALALLCAAAPASAAVRKLTMSVTQITAHFAPYLIAADKGYFAAEGLAMEFIVASGGSATAALLSGGIDFTASAASTVNAILRGAPLRVIYTLADRPAYQLWSTDPTLKTLADLKGRQVGIASRGDTYEIAMRLTLRQAGLPSDWVGYTPLGVGGARDAALVSGALPALVIPTAELAPLRDSAALKRGHLVVDMEETIRMPYTGIATSLRLMRAEPAVVVGFLRATVKGMRSMRADKEATIALLARRTPKMDRRELAADYDDTIATATPDGTAPDALIAADLAVRAELLDLAKDKVAAPGQVYDYGALRQATAALDASGWTPAP